MPAAGPLLSSSAAAFSSSETSCSPPASSARSSTSRSTSTSPTRRSTSCRHSPTRPELTRSRGIPASAAGSHPLDTIWRVDSHALRVLEFDKIRSRLAGLTSFGAGRDLALALEPTPDFQEALVRQRRLAEAIHLRALRAPLNI